MMLICFLTSTNESSACVCVSSVSTGRIEHALDIGPLGAAYNSGIAKARQLVASVSGRVQRTLESVVDGRSLKLSGGGGGGGGVEVEGKAWCVRVKSVCLALDGGLFDATLASAVAALGTLKFPPLQEIDGLNSSLKSAGNNVSPSEVVFKCIPCCTGLVLYKDYTLVDPTEEEESLASAHVSIVLTGEDKFHSMDVAAAGQRVSIDALTMQKCRAIASKRTMERIGKLEEIVGHL